ncbi:MAG TPA: hypothetical protein VF725_06415 [Ktedonobacterales bacterium]
MIWLIWRQRRRELVFLVLTFAAIATYLIVTGYVVYAAYYHMTNGVSVAMCQQQQRNDALCGALVNAFFAKYGNYQFGMMSLPFPAPLAGMFLAAPLVARELESGTFQLVWTQSVTRLRWLLTNVGAQVGILLALSALLIPLFRWWAVPFNPTNGGIGSQTFDFAGTLPLAYMIFALALGIAAGALLRRTIPAMFATLVGYVAIRAPLENWVRPHYLPPLVATWDPSLSSGPGTITANATILSSGYADRAGHQLDWSAVYQACSASGDYDLRPGSSYTACVHAHGWLSTMVWQPANRYWLFQGIESAIFVGLAILLLALAFFWVQRRLS